MSERSALRLDVAVGVIIKHQGKNEPALSRNLSPRGMFVATRQRWPVGTLLDVEIVHQTCRISARVRIANHGATGMGFEFVDAETLEATITTLLQGFLPFQADDPNARVAGTNKMVLRWEPADAETGFWPFKNRQQKAQLIDLSLDGAALVAKKPPEIGEALVVQIPNLIDGADADWVTSQAKVVRHTEHGFAVQFVTPSTLFRRCVSEIRRAARRDRAKEPVN